MEFVSCMRIVLHVDVVCERFNLIDLVITFRVSLMESQQNSLHKP